MEVDNFLRIFLSTIFIFSGLIKIVNLSSFKETIEGLGIKQKWVSVSSIGVPVSEVIVAVLILSNKLRWLGELGLIILLAIFGWATWLAVGKNHKIKCGCFGELAHEYFGWNTIVKIGVLLTLDLYLIFFSQNDLDYFQISNINIISSIVSSIGIIILYLVGVNLRSINDNTKGGELLC